jgi:hypothetical protein
MNKIARERMPDFPFALVLNNIVEGLLVLTSSPFLKHPATTSAPTTYTSLILLNTNAMMIHS